MNDQLPLITFALFAYNQENYIREAVEGAFAQTYENLEIILTDDCSSDNTWGIIKEMVEDYSGSHQIIINRNNKNCGLASSVNWAFQTARGLLIVIAAGDDISFPNRTEVLVRAWYANDCPSGIGSSYCKIDESGEVISRSDSKWFTDRTNKINSTPKKDHLKLYMEEGRVELTGCAAAWDPKVIQDVGPIGSDVRNEDTILSLRSCMLNGLTVVDEKLLNWRIHPGNSFPKSSCSTCTFQLMENYLSDYSVRKSMVLQTSYFMRKDLNHFRNSLSSFQYVEIVTHIERQISALELECKWWDLSFCKRLMSLNELRFNSFPLYPFFVFPRRIYIVAGVVLKRMHGAVLWLLTSLSVR